MPGRWPPDAIVAVLAATAAATALLTATVALVVRPGDRDVAVAVATIATTFAVGVGRWLDHRGRHDRNRE